MIDPVEQPKEYQQMVLSYLEGRDVVQTYRQTPDQMEAIVADAGDRLRERPAEGEWSVLEVLGHIVDGEVASGARMRWVLAEDEPPLPGYDQERWVERLRHNEDDPAELLQLLRVLRRSNLLLWERASPEERGRVGIHAERGPESFDLLFQLAAGHGLLHLEQMEQTAAAVNATG
jgi:DinB superfamily